jgi:acyl carrier protein
MKETTPRGIEVLVKKAAVDPAFKAILLERRAAAAQEIGLELKPAEAAMIGAVPAGQLEAIIGGTTVPLEHRRAFLGHAAVAMLAAVGAMSSALGAEPPPEVQVSNGIRALPPTEKPKPDPAKPKTVEQRVIGLVEKQFVLAPEIHVINGLQADPVPPRPPKQEITRATSLVKDLGATSAGLLKFKQALQQEFDIVILPADFKQIETVGQAVEQVEKTLKDKAAGVMPPRPNPGPVSRAVRIDRPIAIPPPNRNTN